MPQLDKSLLNQTAFSEAFFWHMDGGKIGESAGIAFISTYNMVKHAELCPEKELSENRPKPGLMLDGGISV